MTRRATTLPFLSLLTALLLPAVARAQQDPFSLSAQSTSGPPAQVTVSGSTVVGLVEDVIKSKNQFVPLQGQSVNASLTYGGINNAIQFQRNAAGTSATLTIPSTGFTRTFTGATSGEVNTQIRDFLIKSGAHEFAQFRRTLSEQSPIAVVDGNPQAATAMLSNSAYYKFGLQRSPLTGGALSSTTPSGAGFRLDVNGGFTDTDFGDGQFVTGELSTAIRLGDRIGISFAFPGMYRTVGDAQVYMAGLEIAVPIVILKPFAGHGLVWQVTPDVAGAAAGSVDMVDGALFYSVGGTSSLTIPLGGATAITIGNGIYFYHGSPLDWGDYHFETDLDQQVLKNGIKLTQAIGPLSIDAGLTYTNFFQTAALEHYWSPSVGLVLGAGNLGIRVAYQGDYADHYTSHGGTVAFYLNY